MAIKIKAPAFPESIADGEVAEWHKKEGDSVSRDELIVEIETDKVVMEVVAPEDGVLTKIYVQTGETIDSEEFDIIYSCSLKKKYEFEMDESPEACKIT